MVPLFFSSAFSPFRLSQPVLFFFSLGGTYHSGYDSVNLTPMSPPCPPGPLPIVDPGSPPSSSLKKFGPFADRGHSICQIPLGGSVEPVPAFSRRRCVSGVEIAYSPIAPFWRRFLTPGFSFCAASYLDANLPFFFSGTERRPLPPFPFLTNFCALPLL